MPFTVPEGYFDALPSRIQAETVNRSHRFTISWSWQRTAATLAGAGLVAALVWITYPPRQGPLGPDVLSEVSDAAIVEYLNDQALADEVLADIPVIDEEMATDSSLIHYLDVSPGAIRQQLESEPVLNGANQDS
ncbi:hypothetical protein [Tellurirhabdus rosea]|uniref:hypothetical protein n=1 Tax=Tellurirhabdus rosea TaxID=2674997 RepID=UPI002256C0F5|nr:hypothetical protein [Tellurirhabdus rosea]